MSLRARLAAALPELKERGLHRHHAAEADEAYRACGAQRPDAVPDAATLARVEQYAGDVLGSRAYAPWLKAYTAWRGRFVEGWLPDTYFAAVVIPALQNLPTKRVSGAKTLARRTLMSELLPDLASHVRGCWLDRDGRPVAPQDVAGLLFAQTDAVFVKLDRSARGRDIHRITREAFDLERVAALGDFVVQAPVVAAAELAAVNPESLSPMRITTVKRRGAPAEARTASVVFGRAGAAWMRADTAIVVSVVDAEGNLNDYGLDHHWQRCTAHPDSGVAFAGIRVPAFAEARAAACALHDRVPHLAIIGWDFAIDRDHRPRILELNTGHVGFKASEAMVGPLFAGLGWEQLWRKKAVELGW